MRRVTIVLRCFIMAGIIGGLVLLSGQEVDAKTVYSYQDETSSFTIKGSHIRMKGEHVVWREGGQVRYGNVRTGEKIVITNHGKLVDTTNVGINASGEVIVVWADKRNDNEEKTNFNWDIYSYNLNTKQETKLNDAVGQHRIPSIDGNYIVWQTNPDYEMHVYDLVSATSTTLGKGRDPVISKGRIVYKGATDGGLYEYDMATQVHKKILDLPYSQYVERFVFDGERILWKQKNLDGYAKYTFMDISEDDAQPVDLTPSVKQEVEYKEMSISSGTAVWLEASGGSVVLKGADLTGNAIFSLGEINPSHFIGLQNDEVVLAKNGNIVNRSIVKTETNSQSNAPIISEGTVIGADGGIVSTGSAVSLTFEPGTFLKDTRIVLKDKSKDDVFQSVSQSDLQWAGIAWEWTSESELKKPTTLTFELLSAIASAAQANRIGVYRYVESSGDWEYAGGTLDQAWQTVRAKVTEPGLYAVFTYTPAFKDMKSHWGKSEVEVLASRWIVNGMQSGNFEPNQPVTRAQFAKMLVEASGMVKGKSEAASFRDVPKSHWASGWIQQAAEAGWIKGYEGGLFKPDAYVSREEMIVMLANAAQLEKKEESDALSSYSDANTVSGWARQSVEAAMEYGIVRGNGNKLNPKGTSTRAEAATVIYRWLVMKGEIFNE